MNLPLNKFEDENRAPFTKEELEKLMRSNEYVYDKHWKSYQFWTPIIALFTGMRQNEIAQLHLKGTKGTTTKMVMMIGVSLRHPTRNTMYR